MFLHSGSESLHSCIGLLPVLLLPAPSLSGQGTSRIHLRDFCLFCFFRSNFTYCWDLNIQYDVEIIDGYHEVLTISIGKALRILSFINGLELYVNSITYYITIICKI